MYLKKCVYYFCNTNTLTERQKMGAVNCIVNRGVNGMLFPERVSNPRDLDTKSII